MHLLGIIVVNFDIIIFPILNFCCYIANFCLQELLEKCDDCEKIIRAAKGQQAAKANKNASILLEELDLEKTRRVQEGSSCQKARKKKEEKT